MRHAIGGVAGTGRVAIISLMLLGQYSHNVIEEG